MEEKVICSSCQELKPLQETSLQDGRVKQYFRLSEKLYKAHAICQSCMKTKNILIADWEKQTTKGYLCFDWPAILYYRPYEIKCKACQKNFLFSAQEQQFWYETAQIFTDAAPKMCVTCRKKARFVAEINAVLVPLLKNSQENPSKETYLKIANLYIELGNKREAGVYLAKAKTFV